MTELGRTFILDQQQRRSRAELGSGAGTTLTGRQGGVAGDTHPGLLPVHVNQFALQAAARCTEHLQDMQMVSLQTTSRTHNSRSRLYAGKRRLRVSFAQSPSGSRKFATTVIAERNETCVFSILVFCTEIGKRVRVRFFQFPF